VGYALAGIGDRNRELLVLDSIAMRVEPADDRTGGFGKRRSASAVLSEHPVHAGIVARQLDFGDFQAALEDRQSSAGCRTRIAGGQAGIKLEMRKINRVVVVESGDLHVL